MEQIKVKLTEDIYVTVNVETPSPSRAMEYCGEWPIKWMSSEDLDKFAEVNPKLNYLSFSTCAEFRKWDFSFADVYPTYDRNHEYLRLSHPCWEPFVAAFMDRVWQDYLEGKEPKL